MSIYALMHEHHVHCDDLFIALEELSVDGDWNKVDAAMRAFVDELETHFKAEEETLFPAFEQATGSRDGPTSVMRMEHGQMRDLVTQMNNALSAKNRDDIGGAAQTLLVLMQQHNMKEENILYPMCDRALDANALVPTLRQRLQRA